MFPTVDGSSQFQVMVFKPDMSILAAPRLCICDLCKQSYGSCSLFETYHLDVQNLKSTTLRSNEVSDEDHVVSKELVIQSRFVQLQQVKILWKVSGLYALKVMKK